jgi:hypothetical protein
MTFPKTEKLEIGSRESYEDSADSDLRYVKLVYCSRSFDKVLAYFVTEKPA